MTAPNETPDLERLGELARSRGLRVSVAESLTSGRLANTIGAGEGPPAGSPAASSRTSRR